MLEIWYDYDSILELVFKAYSRSANKEFLIKARIIFKSKKQNM